MKKNTHFIKRNKDQYKKLIINKVKEKTFENTKQLVIFMNEHYALAKEQTIKVLIELENENKLRFVEKLSTKIKSAREYQTKNNFSPNQNNRKVKKKMPRFF